MMKKSKKTLSLLLALTTMASMGACGPQLIDSVPDDRVVLSISLYAGGYGTDWMDNLIDHLNESQETYWYTRLEDNKMASGDIAGRILGGLVEADIYFTTPADVEELVARGMLESLKDVYESTPEGEEQTIKEKTLNYESYEKYFSDENGVYVMPNQLLIDGLIYDHDLFVKNDWLFKDDSTESGLTKGADGKEGTYDDGLPITYEDFKELVEQIVAEQYTPFIYGDGIGFGQMMRFLEGIWAQHEGLENYNVGLTFNGTYTSPSTGVKTSVTPATGWKVFQNNLQEGRIKAMQFVSEMVYHAPDGYLFDDRSGLSHTDAQAVYVTSHATKQIAMLFDGGWWENEAKRAFDEDAKNNNEDYAFGKRDFRLMPVPTFEGQSQSTVGKHYFEGDMGAASSFAVKPSVFNPQISEEDAAIKREGIIQFFKAYASDWNCLNYTQSSGCFLPFKYELTTEELEPISKFAKNVYDIIHDESTVLVSYYWPQKDIPLENPPDRWGTVKIGGAAYSTHAQALQSTSFADYIRGLQYDTWNETNWKK